MSFVQKKRPFSWLTHSFVAMSRTRVSDLVPDQWGARAHQPPILLFEYANDVSLDSTGTRPTACTSLGRVSVTGTYGWREDRAHCVVEFLVPWFAIRLIPIYHPMCKDVRRSLDKRAAIWTPDGDIFYLGWHIHTRIDGSPSFRYVS